MKGKTPPEERMRAESFLKKEYPHTFLPPGQVKPLEIGIKGRLIADVKDKLPEDISLRAIYVALHYYCCTKEYKKARKILGNSRIDLNGQATGKVNESDLELGKQHNAETRRKKHEKKVKERSLEQSKLEKQAQIQRAAARKAAKEAARAAQAARTATAKAVKGRKTTKTVQPVKTAVKTTKFRTSSTVTTQQQPTITVRKRKVLSLPKKDK
jgi:sRNA-binding protein